MTCVTQKRMAMVWDLISLYFPVITSVFSNRKFGSTSARKEGARLLQIHKTIWTSSGVKDRVSSFSYTVSYLPSAGHPRVNSIYANVLLGAPGVGKTCTAECIADLMMKPLYPITCGDLGSTAEAVEKGLKKHFTLASKWNCVMLLDEADVFLAKRKQEDLVRNSIVSVFLRMLEYYKGLLFLTTNRVGAFDEAFKSRVHISLFCESHHNCLLAMPFPSIGTTSTICLMVTNQLNRPEL